MSTASAILFPNSETNKPKSKKILTSLAREYLTVAIEKYEAPLHPNFVKLATSPSRTAKQREGSQKRIEAHKHIASICAKHKQSDVARHIVAVLNDLSTSVAEYSQFLKDLCANAAFAGNMEYVKLSKPKVASSVMKAGTEDMLSELSEAKQDVEQALSDGTPYEDDLPVFDQGEAESQAAEYQAASNGEEREQDSDTLAEDREEIEAAMETIALWLGLGASRMTEQQRGYWIGTNEPLIPFGTMVISVDGLPKEYVPILDWETYVTYSRDVWEKKRNTVGGAPDVLDMMAEG